MRVFHDRNSQRVELTPENETERRCLEEQFGPWETCPDAEGLRGPAGDDFELMICRRERDGAVLIEIALAPEAEE